MDLSKQTLLCEALSLFALKAPEAELIRHNENMTYRVTDGGKSFVLRIHSPVEGFSLEMLGAKAKREALIQNELEIVSALAAVLALQKPVRGIGGGYVPLAGDTPVSLLEWVEGETVDSIVPTQDILRNIGKMTALMHNFFAGNSARYGYRYNYDQTILPPICERIKCAGETGYIGKEQAGFVLSALDEIKRRFGELDKTNSKSIVHSDLSKSNMILKTDGSIIPIDFSLCGYSHYYMDIGALFGHFGDDGDRRLILEGYKEARDCDLNPYYIEPYYAMQVILFIAGQYERTKDWDWFGGAMERWCGEIFVPLAEKKAVLSLPRT